MSRQARADTGRSLLSDERGAVSLEYVIITSFALVVAAAVAMLGMAQAASEQRSNGILISNSP